MIKKYKFGSISGHIFNTSVSICDDTGGIVCISVSDLLQLAILIYIEKK